MPVGSRGGSIGVRYSTPELKFLGSLAALTLGQNGSCPDGGGYAATAECSPVYP
jgi:hypothetical protein